MADIEDVVNLLAGVVNHLYEIRKQLDRQTELLVKIEKNTKQTILGVPDDKR